MNHYIPELDGVRGVATLLAVIVAVEAGLILGPGGFARQPVLGGDGPIYFRLAENLADRGRFSGEDSLPYGPTVFRTPGYPAFVALTFAVGRSPLVVRVAQFGVLWLTTCLLYFVGLRTVGRPAALAGAILCATYPPLALACCYHLTEMPVTCLAVGLVALLAVGADRPGIAIGLGLVTGVSALVRPSMAPLGGVAAIAPLLSAGAPRRRLVMSLLGCVGFWVCVLPWAARNHAVTGRYLPLAVSGFSPYTSARQYLGEISYRFTVSEWQAYIADNVRRDREARAGVRIDSPIATTIQAELAVDRSYHEDTSRLWRRLTFGRVARSVPVRVAYLWATGDWLTGWPHRAVQVIHAVLAMLALVGMMLARMPTRAWVWLLLMPVYFTGLHLVYHMETRYSLPARPFLLLFAGVGIVPPRWDATASRARV
jgi:4-amino-4-deoxy-L-arabinose transferase-like glycosyltransferase